MSRTSAVVIVLAGLTVAGCAAGGAADRDARTAGPQSLAASSRTLADLPVCDTIAAVECRIGEKISGATLVVHPGSTGTVQIDVIADDGTVRQTLTEITGSQPGTPRLAELTTDGRPTLVVPLDIGPVNTHYAVYRTDAAGRFVRAGEAGGTDFARTDSGYIAITAGQGPVDWSVAFYRMPDTQLLPVATASVHQNPEAPGGFDCTVADGGGPVRSGLTDKQATAQFCAEPAVLAAAAKQSQPARGAKPTGTTSVSASPTATVTTTTTAATTTTAPPTTTSQPATTYEVTTTTAASITLVPETPAAGSDPADTSGTAGTTAVTDTTDNADTH